MGYLTSYIPITFCVGAILTPNLHKTCKTRGGLYKGHVSNSGEDQFNRLNTSHMQRFGQFFRNKSKTLCATAFLVLQVLPKTAKNERNGGENMKITVFSTYEVTEPLKLH